jgi:hypothetical protein
MASLTRRCVRMIASDRGYVTLMGLLPVALGLLTQFVGTSQGLKRAASHQQQRAGTAADAGHLRLPGRSRELGRGTG